MKIQLFLKKNKFQICIFLENKLDIYRPSSLNSKTYSKISSMVVDELTTVDKIPRFFQTTIELR